MTCLKIIRLTSLVAVALVAAACDSSTGKPASAGVGEGTDAGATASGARLNPAEGAGDPTVAAVDGLDRISVLALGPADGRAVIALPGGKMQVIKVGERLPGTEAMVIQVLQDKLVVEETVEQPGEAPVKQIAWLHKPDASGKRARVQRLDQIGPEKELLRRPADVVPAK